MSGKINKLNPHPRSDHVRKKIYDPPARSIHDNTISKNQLKIKHLKSKNKQDHVKKDKTLTISKNQLKNQPFKK